MRGARPVLFGEVLFDRFPDGRSVLGGAPFNVAWHLQAFGLSPLFVSRVGDDDAGREVLEAMRSWGMDVAGVQLDRARPTGAVEVSIRGGEPSYDILTEQAYDHIEPDELPTLAAPGLLYHGTLALRSSGPREALERLRHSVGPRGTTVRRLVDVNLRAPFWRRDDVRRLLVSAAVLKLNEGELELLTSCAGSPEDAARGLLEDTGAERVVMTRGERGVLAIDRRHGRLEGEPSGSTEVVDTVGAGDAFTSALVLGDHLGWDLETTLQRGLAFAEAIVGLRGATCSERVFYTPFQERWELT